MTPEQLAVLILGTLAIIFGRMAWGYRYELVDWWRAHTPVSSVPVQRLTHHAADYVTLSPETAPDSPQTTPSAGLSAPSAALSAAAHDITTGLTRQKLITLVLAAHAETNVSDIRTLLKGDNGDIGNEIRMARVQLGLPEPMRQMHVYRGRGSLERKIPMKPLP